MCLVGPECASEWLEAGSETRSWSLAPLLRFFALLYPLWSALEASHKFISSKSDFFFVLFFALLFWVEFDSAFTDQVLNVSWLHACIWCSSKRKWCTLQNGFQTEMTVLISNQSSDLSIKHCFKLEDILYNIMVLSSLWHLTRTLQYYNKSLLLLITSVWSRCCVKPLWKRSTL